MEHFAVIQSLVRSALSDDKAGVVKQVGRLRDRLLKAGETQDAAVLVRLLDAVEEAREMAPSRVEVSRSLVSGERLTPDTNVPIDKETGARLCMVEFGHLDDQPPVHGEAVRAAVDGLLEEWSNAVALQSVGVEPTHTLLIYGPPGSGKTITARHIAGRLGLPLVTARIDGLISSFLGTTARNIANLFAFANRYACVLLLDEFDALAKLRDDPQEIGEIKRVVNTLLQNLDERRGRGVTIAITNHDRLLDPAVWRRFETQLHMGDPNLEVRERMVARFLKPIPTEGPTLKVFAYVLAGRSGADLERICSAVKRTLALGGEAHDAPGLFRALGAVMSRMPEQSYAPARVLATDLEAFVSLVANEPDLGLKQTEIGDATGFSQPRISELKKSRRHLSLMELTNA